MRRTTSHEAPEEERHDDIFDSMVRRVAVQERIVHRGLMHEYVKADRERGPDQQGEIQDTGNRELPRGRHKSPRRILFR